MSASEAGLGITCGLNDSFFFLVEKAESSFQKAGWCLPVHRTWHMTSDREERPGLARVRWEPAG